MEKRIDMDALKVIAGGVMPDHLGDGPERRRGATEKELPG